MLGASLGFIKPGTRVTVTSITFGLTNNGWKETWMEDTFAPLSIALMMLAFCVFLFSLLFHSILPFSPLLLYRRLGVELGKVQVYQEANRGETTECFHTTTRLN